MLNRSGGACQSVYMYSIKTQAMFLSIGVVLTLRSAFLDSCNDPDDFCVYTKALSGAFVVLEVSLAFFLTVGRCKPYFKTVGEDGLRCKHGLQLLECTADCQDCPF